MHADIARVRREHDELDRQAGDLQFTIANGTSHSGETFAQLAAYASVLSEHLLGEHEVLEDAQSRSTASGARQMRTELDALRWDWDEYLSVWTEESARADWDMFREHSLIILDRIRQRIRRENELLGD